MLESDIAVDDKFTRIYLEGNLLLLLRLNRRMLDELIWLELDGFFLAIKF